MFHRSAARSRRDPRWPMMARLWMPVLACALLGTSPAVPDDALPANAVSDDASSGPPDRTPEQKQRARNTVVLMAIVTGIALTGLLLVIIAVAARGMTRKLATTDIEESPALPDKKKVEPPVDDAAEPAVEPQIDQSRTEAH